MVLSPYKTLISKIIPLSYHHDIEGLLDSLLPDADESLRFQLQAEVRRLTSPSLRVLDLRSLFAEQCELIRHQGLEHYLPNALTRRFTVLLNDFNGNYTRGVYEAIISELAALRKLPTQFNTLSWHLPALGQQRKEERLRFVTPVLLHLEDHEPIQGNSLDISGSGLLVQLSATTPLPEQIKISLPELAKLPDLACLAEPTLYRVRPSASGPHRLAMQRLSDDAQWQQALSTFIERNRPYYRLDADDLASTVKFQSWGQALLETSAMLSLFFDKQGELKNLFTNRFSRQVLQHWQQDSPGDTLVTLLSPARVLQLSEQNENSSLLYSFCYQGGEQEVYFVAHHQQLIAQQSYAAFIEHGLKAGNLVCYHLTWHPIRYPDQLAEVLDNEGARQLEPLAWQMWLTPLPITPPVAPAHSSLKQLAPFIQPLRRQTITAIPVERQASKRKETRFKFRSALSISLGNKVMTGHSEDISLRGIKVRLDSPVSLTTPCQVMVHLTELHQRSRQWQLKNLPYRVINQSEGGKVVHLRLIGREEQHGGFRFLNALFEQNQDKLRARPQSQHTPQWLIWLHRQTLKHPSAPTFLLGRNESSFYVQGAIACLNQPDLMRFLSNPYHQAHFSRLVSRQLLQSVFSQLQRPDGRQFYYLEIWTAVSRDQQPCLLVDPEPQKQAFFLDKRHHSELRVSLMVFNRLQQRQLDFLLPEWEELTQVSLYKRQQLEQLMAELAILSQIFDITEAVVQAAAKTPVTTPTPLLDSTD